MEFVILIGIAWLVYLWLKKNDTNGAIDPARLHHDRTNQNLNPSKLDIAVTHRKFADSSSGRSRESTTELIQRAIDSKKSLRFKYIDQDGAITHRTVTPNYLESRHDSETLCLIAYCHLRGASRTFVVRRMRQVSVE